MTNADVLAKRFTYKTRRIFFDNVVFRSSEAHYETATVSSGVYTRLSGKKPDEIIIKGHFSPDELEFFRGLIEISINSVDDLYIGGATIEDVTLLEGEAHIDDGHFLGEYTFRFGGLTDGLYSKAYD